MKQYRVIRYGLGRNSTLGYWTRVEENGAETELCFNLEDERRATKVQGETCIPVGSYALALRTEGGMHAKYLDRFGTRHKGMIWLQNVPGFEWVYVHIGNREDQTKGCLLPGTLAEITADGEFRVLQSEPAYWLLYEEIAPVLISGERVVIHVTELQPWA